MSKYTTEEWAYPFVGMVFGIAAGVTMDNMLVGAALAIIFSFVGYAIAHRSKDD
ncbi:MULTISPECIES: hypothetical protein [Corynebacterium]|mgnify:CR=1 FL=1|uniref:Uncharacterized protein n=1 Tax=Corynebacterium evansiae TaxID=2913499 RepID=A0A9X3LIV0_9CORY|nr:MULTISPECIES: hypothetical protein [Corynebacterium]MCG7258327.1 hypothetical protein [Corynebacterium sp. ACRQK]MCG7262872.1 hypothetical protein [Corynebacterium sp. ACRQL]MCG7456000.1 hypothetical protein [Corynebacterium sp. ACRPH]MCZ9288677.1 hypothetical protein [Corynebacterium evansiae]